MSVSVCHPEAMPEGYKQHISSWEDHRDSLVLRVAISQSVSCQFIFAVQTVSLEVVN
jgi:hypothetical protein